MRAVEEVQALRAKFRRGEGTSEDCVRLYEVERWLEGLVARAVASDEITAQRAPALG